MRRLVGPELEKACETIVAHHYTHSIPSGKKIAYQVGDAVVMFAIPANAFISKFLLGEPNRVWELARLWAPDGHEPNLLTAAISRAVSGLRQEIPTIDALVSYADPNVGHRGGVYRAASWRFLGQCEETRAYRSADGQLVARRKFHSGRRSMRKSEIESLGYVEERLPGKLRFAKGLTKKARKAIDRKAA